MTHNLSLSFRGRSVLVLFFLALLIVIEGCRSYVPIEPELEVEGEPVRTTIAGTVVDEEGLPVANVAITAHGQSTTTNKFGYFILENVRAPKHRAVVLAKLDGYFSSSRATIPSENGLTEVLLNMMSYGTRTTVNASSGGSVHVTSASGEASVRFAPGGMTVGGTPYSGEAHVAMRYLDPVESSFARYFSGDEAAVRSSGRNAMLVSYGVLRVDMRTPSGEAIQPAPGKPAEITYPVPSTLKNPPQSIPLWYFDEERGLWVEEGNATKQGNNYVGTVKHFTDWNLDVPDDQVGRISGKVLCGSRGMGGVVVRIGQVTVVTSSDGQFSRRVPANLALDVEVGLDDNGDSYGSDVIRVPAIPGGQEARIVIQLTTGCPATITGTLTNGKGSSIPGAVTVVKPNKKVRTVTSLDGAFEVKVQAESQSQLYMWAWACDEEKAVLVQGGVSESVTNIGSHSICSELPGGEDTVIVGKDTVGKGGSTIRGRRGMIGGDKGGIVRDAGGGSDTVGGVGGGNDSVVVEKGIAIPDVLSARVTLSQNGMYAAVVNHGSVATVYNTQTEKLVSTTEVSSNPGWVSNPQFSEDGSKYLVNRFTEHGNVAFVIETRTGKLIGGVPITNDACLYPDGKSVLLWGVVGNKLGLQKYSITNSMVERSYDVTNITQFAQIRAISQDGKKAVLENGGVLFLFDLEQGVGRQVTSAGEGADAAFFFALSSDVSAVSFVDRRTNTFKAYDLVTGKEIGGGNVTVNSLYHTYHSDSKHVMLMLRNNNGTSTLSLLNVRTGIVSKVLTVTGTPVLCGNPVISRDGKRASGIFREGKKLLLKAWDL